MHESYQPHDIESRVQDRWQQEGVFRAQVDPTREKFYCLTMFPYPSGHLHMGHVRNYTIGDVISRFQRMLGKNVLQPMGWDAFGLPAENAAIVNQAIPAQWTYQNIDYMRQQLKALGFGYDWSREFATCQESYYRWEQWFFQRLLDKGLAYRQKSAVNWCPHDQTVLANEQVHDGHCWRCDTRVERREINQWFIRTTAKADELLAGLDQLPGWPEEVKAMQRNWIGRSEGLALHFKLKDRDTDLAVYTTRPDTLFGVTYMALAAEHPLTLELAAQDPKLQAFVDECRQQGTAEAAVATQDKRGIALPLTAIHPITGDEIPVWAANFVLMDYGSGAVMSVPAHDERDWAFAQQYGLPIRQVIAPTQGDAIDVQEAPFTERGVLVNSGSYTGLSSAAASTAIAEAIEAQGLGERTIQYRLRDWGVSRQRYWGAPVPVVYVDGEPKPAQDLPVTLPEQVAFTGIQSPLVNDPDFLNTTYDGQPATRETDTFDTFMESSWYHARFTSAHFDQAMLDPVEANYWLPVDQYIGGIEHATMHLMYSRFYHKAMRDEGLVNSDEPFTNLLCQGMVLADSFYKMVDGARVWVNPRAVTLERDSKGQIIQAIETATGDKLVHAGMSKMSKSKNNGVDPQEAIGQYGADTVRLFAIFAAPPEQTLEWIDSGVQGAHRFLNRLWRAVFALQQSGLGAPRPDQWTEAAQTLRRKTHQTLAKVTDDYGRRMTFNTAIAAIMELLNDVSRFTVKDDASAEQWALREALEHMVLMLQPVAPHITQQLWEALGHDSLVVNATWPTVDESALESDQLTYVVQVNGKVRARIEVASDATKEQVEAAARNADNVQRFIADQTVQRVIVVPGKLVNIVVKP